MDALKRFVYPDCLHGMSHQILTQPHGPRRLLFLLTSSSKSSAFLRELIAALLLRHKRAEGKRILASFSGRKYQLVIISDISNITFVLTCIVIRHPHGPHFLPSSPSFSASQTPPTNRTHISPHHPGTKPSHQKHPSGSGQHQTPSTPAKSLSPHSDTLFPNG